MQFAPTCIRQNSPASEDAPGRLPSLGRGRRSPQAPRPVPPTRQRPPGRPRHRCRYSFSFPSYPLCCSQGYPAGIDCLQFAFYTADAAFDLLEASTVGRIVTYLCQYGYTYHEGLIDPPYGQFDGVLIDQQRRQPPLDGRSRDRYLSAEREILRILPLHSGSASLPANRLCCPPFLPLMEEKGQKKIKGLGALRSTLRALRRGGSPRIGPGSLTADSMLHTLHVPGKVRRRP